MIETTKVECEQCGGCGLLPDEDGAYTCRRCDGTGERDTCRACAEVLDPVEVEHGCIGCCLRSAAEMNRRDHEDTLEGGWDVEEPTIAEGQAPVAGLL